MKPKRYDPTTITTTTFDDPETFRAALTGADRRASRRAQQARPDLPRAGRASATGLGGLIKRGWSLEYVVGKGYRLRHYDGRATCYFASEGEACAEAKGMEKR